MSTISTILEPLHTGVIGWYCWTYRPTNYLGWEHHPQLEGKPRDHVLHLYTPVPYTGLGQDKPREVHELHATYYYPPPRILQGLAA